MASIVMAWFGAMDPAMASAAYPGTNGKIAFSSNRDIGSAEIYSVIPGETAERLTVSGGSSDPVYSPDGTQIAFVSGNQIWVMNADGSGRTQITTTPTSKHSPTWSPGGTRIAYEANSFDVDGQTDLEIWSINADGTGRTQLTNNTFLDREPAWSPLGDKIAFVGSRPGDTNRNVYVMNADGSGQISITPNSPPGCSPCYQGHDENPAWSPDGSRIAYVHPHFINGGGLPAIWTMGPNGAGKVNLSDNNDVSFTQPAWSPEADRIAFVGVAPMTTNRDIWVMSSDGSGQTPIEPNPAHDINPDWGPAAPVVTPPNDFTFEDVKKKRKRGIAILTVGLPGGGDLELRGKGIKRVEKFVGDAGDAKLRVKPKGRKLRKLRENGKVRVRPKVTFTPTGGAPNTEATRIKLVKK